MCSTRSGGWLYQGVLGLGSQRACLQRGWNTSWEHLVLRVRTANYNGLGLFLRTGFSLGLYNIATQSSTQVPGIRYRTWQKRWPPTSVRSGFHYPKCWCPPKAATAWHWSRDHSMGISSPHRQWWRLTEFIISVIVAICGPQLCWVSFIYSLSFLQEPCKWVSLTPFHRCNWRVTYLLTWHSLHKDNVNYFLQLIWTSLWVPTLLWSTKLSPPN